MQAGCEPLTRLWAHMGGGCVDRGALGSGGNHLDGHIVSRLGAFWKICHSGTHWRQTRDVRTCLQAKYLKKSDSFDTVKVSISMKNKSRYHFITNNAIKHY